MSSWWFHFGDALAGAVLAHVLRGWRSEHLALSTVLAMYVLARCYELFVEDAQ